MATVFNHERSTWKCKRLLTGRRTFSEGRTDYCQFQGKKRSFFHTYSSSVLAVVAIGTEVQVAVGADVVETTTEVAC